MGIRKINFIKYFKYLKAIWNTISPKILGFVKKYSYEIVFVIIFLLSIYLRFYRLNILPPGVHEDEATFLIKSVGGLEVGTDLVYRLGLLIFGGILGNELMSYRFFSAFLGSLVVLLTFIFCRSWFNRRIALISTFFLAFSFWPILVSRTISHFSLISILLLLILMTGSLAFREKKKIYFILLGVLIGIGYYTSLIFWVLPIVFLPVFLMVYFKKPKIVIKYEKELFWLEIVILVAAVPGLLYFIFNPEVLHNLWPGFLTFLKNGFKSLLIFNLETPVIWHINLGKEPLLDPLSGIAFLAGLLIVLKHHKRTKYQLILVLFFVLMISTFFTKNYLYALNAASLIPIIYILVGIAIDWTYNKWTSTFPLNKYLRYGGFVFLVTLFMVSGFFNVYKYFVVWPKSPEVYVAYNEDILAQSKYLKSLPQSEPSYYSKNSRNIILKAIGDGESLELAVEEIAGVSLSSGKNIFVINETDGAYLNKVQEVFPGGSLGEFLSPYSKKTLFIIYSVQGEKK